MYYIHVLLSMGSEENHMWFGVNLLGLGSSSYHWVVQPDTMNFSGLKPHCFGLVLVLTVLVPSLAYTRLLKNAFKLSYVIALEAKPAYCGFR
jgi:hypothetical protein